MSPRPFLSYLVVVQSFFIGGKPLDMSVNSLKKNAFFERRSAERIIFMLLDTTRYSRLVFSLTLQIVFSKALSLSQINNPNG